MNNDKLKELEELCSIAEDEEFYLDEKTARLFKDFITAYRLLERQLESMKQNKIEVTYINAQVKEALKLKEANTELLEALKPLAEMYDKVGENDYVLTNNPDRHY